MSLAEAMAVGDAVQAGRTVAGNHDARVRECQLSGKGGAPPVGDAVSCSGLMASPMLGGCRSGRRSPAGRPAGVAPGPGRWRNPTTSVALLRAQTESTLKALLACAIGPSAVWRLGPRSKNLSASSPGRIRPLRPRTRRRTARDDPEGPHVPAKARAVRERCRPRWNDE